MLTRQCHSIGQPCCKVVSYESVNASCIGNRQLGVMDDSLNENNRILVHNTEDIL